MSEKKLISTLSDMVAIPSVNPMGKNVTGEIYSEKNLTDYLNTRFKKMKMDVQILNEDPEHPCIVAYLNIGAKETLLLDAHLDTVSHENMSIDPFDPVQRDDKIFGRGSCDTKASMAVFIHALEEVLRKGQKPNKNIIITGASDEEFSFGGVRKLIQQDLKADWAIIGEPTLLNAIHRHKGVLRCYFRIKGEGCHSSTPELGVNALYIMSEVILRLKQYHTDLQLKKRHETLGHATLSVGLAGGGTTVNTVAPSAWIEVDRRLLPHEKPSDVFDEINNLIHDMPEVTIESPHVDTGGLETSLDSPVCGFIKHHCASIDHTPNFNSAAYATHGPFYDNLGIPSLVFGPGSIEQAHTAAEFVAIDQLEKASRIIQSMMTSS